MMCGLWVLLCHQKGAEQLTQHGRGCDSSSERPCRMQECAFADGGARCMTGDGWVGGEAGQQKCWRCGGGGGGARRTLQVQGGSVQGQPACVSVLSGPKQ
jgi:hypothetical protein